MIGFNKPSNSQCEKYTLEILRNAMNGSKNPFFRWFFPPWNKIYKDLCSYTLSPARGTGKPSRNCKGSIESLDSLPTVNQGFGNPQVLALFFKSGYPPSICEIPLLSRSKPGYLWRSIRHVPHPRCQNAPGREGNRG